MKFVPQLATEWAWSSDGKALTLKLRDGVLFHDGTKLDADAVKINLDRYRTDPELRRKGEVKPIANVVVVDPLTVRLELAEPYAPLLAVLADRAGMIMSPKALAELGDKIGTKPVCAGPYRFVERVAQERIVVERFDKYWNPGPYTIDRVVYTPVPDTTVRLANLRSGGFEIIDRLAASDVEVGEERPGAAIRRVDGARLQFDVDQPPQRQRRRQPARQGQAGARGVRAVDRPQSPQRCRVRRKIRAVEPVRGAGHPILDRVPPVAGARCRQGPAAAGRRGGAAPSFTLTTPNNTTDMQVAQALQAMSSEAGFEVKIQATEAATMVANNRAGNYQAALAIWSGRPDPDGNISIWIACDGFLNWGKYCNPELDKLLSAARATNEPSERAKLYAKAAELYLADRPELVLYHFKWLWGVSRKVTGFVAASRRHHPPCRNEARLLKSARMGAGSALPRA